MRLIVESYIKTLLINKFKISNVKHSLEFAILDYVVDEFLRYGIGVYANYLYNKLGKKPNKKTFYYKLKQLEKKGVITIKKMDGLLFLELSNPHKKELLNLIYKMQKSNSHTKKLLEDLEGHKASTILKKAREMYRDVVELEPHQIYEVNKLFNLYLEKVDELYLFFKKIGIEINEEDFGGCNNILDLENKPHLKDNILILPYTTRFDKLGFYVNRIKEIIEEGAKRYKYAFFLTLTLKRDKKLLEVNKLIRESWNRLRSYFKKVLGDMAYIKVHEFHLSGYPHLHILIFSNRKWLISQRKLSQLWEKYGMGKIVYIYLLKREGNSFVWVKNKPKDCYSKNITNYLIKYFKKIFRGCSVGLDYVGESDKWVGDGVKLGNGSKGGDDVHIVGLDDDYVGESDKWVGDGVKLDDGCGELSSLGNWQLALFWLTGLRFFTYSYSLNTKKKEKESKPKIWEFVGVFNIFDSIEDIKARLIGRKLEKYVNWVVEDVLYCEGGGYIISRGWSWIL